MPSLLMKHTPLGNGNIGGAWRSPPVLLPRMLQQKHATKARNSLLRRKLPHTQFLPSASRKSHTKHPSIAKSQISRRNLTPHHPSVRLPPRRRNGLYHALYDYSPLETRVSLLFAFASASRLVFVSAKEKAAAIPQSGCPFYFCRATFCYWHLVIVLCLFSFILQRYPVTEKDPY
jgi:hypothetical protein